VQLVISHRVVNTEMMNFRMYHRMSVWGRKCPDGVTPLSS